MYEKAQKDVNKRKKQVWRNRQNAKTHEHHAK